MKKITKRIVGLALTAGLALSVGAGVTAVYSSYEDTTITASAAENVDLVNSIRVRDCGSTGDIADTPLYRILLTENDAAAFDFTNFCANEYGGEALKWIKINGKSIYDHRAEYQAAVQAGERAPVISAQSNIGGNQTADNAYAPIFVWFTNHPSLSAKAIDIFIPSDYLPRDEVTSIEITTDFNTDYINSLTGKTATASYTLSQNVYWTIGGGVRATKYVGGKPAYTTTATTVVAPYINIAEGTNFFSTKLSESDYGNSGPDNVCIPKTTIDALNFWNYVEFDGVSLNKMITDAGIPGEIGFNVWGSMPAFSFRFPSFTADYLNSLTEIKYLKGCQFPSYANPTTVGYELQEDVTFVKVNGEWINKAALKTAADVAFSGGAIGGEAKDYVAFNFKIDGMNMQAANNDDAYNWAYGGGLHAREKILINGKSMPQIVAETDDSGYSYGSFPFNNGGDWSVPVHLVGNQKDSNGLMEVRVHKDYLATLGNEVTITIANGFQNWSKDTTLTEDVSQVYYKYADGSYSTTKMESVETELTEISTTIHSHNFITFYLSNLDLAEGTEGLSSIGRHEATKYSKVNFMDYIYVNGKSLNECNVGEVIYNLGAYNAISIRLMDFGQEGDAGFDNKVFTNAIQTIEIKAGAQFPAWSYAYEGGAVKAYTVDKDTLWVNNGTKWVNECIVTITNEAGETVSTEVVAPLTVLTEPETPVKEVEEGYEVTFLGWYNGEEKWDFTTPVKGDVTLTPKFEVTQALPAPDSELTIPEALELGAKFEHNKYTEGKYYISGTVKQVYNAQYGNMYLVDEAGNEITVYGTYSADGSTRYDAMESKPVEGDTVKVYGIIGTYNSTIQMKNAWIVSFEHNEDYVKPELPENFVKDLPQAGATYYLRAINYEGSYIQAQSDNGKFLTVGAEPNMTVSFELVEGTTNEYYIKLSNGNYINSASSGNAVAFGAEAVDSWILDVENNTIQLKKDAQYYLQYNANAGQERITRYKNTQNSIWYELASEPVPEYIEVYLQPGDNTITMAAGQYALAYMRAAGKFTFSWTGEATIMAGRMPIANGEVVDYNPMMGALKILPANAEAECTIVLTVAEYVAPVLEMQLGANAIVVPVEDYYCAGVEVQFTATEAGEYVLKIAEGEENADVTYIAEGYAEWIENYPYAFSLEAGETIKFLVCTSNVMLTEDTIDLVIEVAADEPIDPPTSEEPIDPPASSDEPTSSEPTDEPTSSDEPTTSEPTDEPTSSEPTDEPTTSEPTDEPEEEKKGGCGSVIGGVSAALALVAAAAIVMKKKED